MEIGSKIAIWRSSIIRNRK